MTVVNASNKKKTIRHTLLGIGAKCVSENFENSYFKAFHRGDHNIMVFFCIFMLSRPFPISKCNERFIDVFTVYMQGENLNSLSMDYYSVAVGGGSCSISFITDTQV